MITPDLILFAAKSCLKLSSQIKKAYIDNVNSRKLILPLPHFPTIVDWRTSMNFFEDAGKEFVESNPRIKELLLKSQYDELTKDEKSEFVIFHQESKAIQQAHNSEFISDGLTGNEMEALVTIVQWKRGKNPNPTALQRVAGSLIEIAVDYFTGYSKALNSDSDEHKALKAFLISIDDTNFAETPVQELAPQLFVSVIETLNQVPELLTNEEKGQDLIKGITLGLSKDINQKINEIHASGGNLQKEENIKKWGLLIFRSTLESAGEVVLAEPNNYLGISDSGSAIVSEVGSAVLEIVLEDVILYDSSEIKIGSLFSKENIDKLIRTTLKTIGEHPELLEIDNNGIKNILTQVIKDLADIGDPYTIHLLPEVCRLIIEKTAGNLSTIWPDDHLQPANHLLLTSTKELLLAISKPTSGVWRPKLTKDQVLEISEYLIDEVVKNPDWILIKINDSKPILRLAIDSVFSALAQVPEERLNRNNITLIIRIAISKVSEGIELLDLFSDQTGEEKTFLTKILEIIFNQVLSDDTDKRVRWTLARDEMVNRLVSSVLTMLINNGISMMNIETIESEIELSIQNVVNGKPYSVDNLIESINKLQLN